MDITIECSAEYSAKTGIQRENNHSTDNYGFEAIFDAILFLTILGVGAVLLQTTMMDALQDTDAGSINETSIQSRSTMEVFLRTWVYFDADGDGEELIRGDTSSVLNEAIHQHRTGEISQSDFNQITSNLDAVLTSIVPPSYGFQFTAELEDSNIHLTLGDEPPEGRNLHFANGNWEVLAIGSDNSDDTLKFELILWIK